VAIDNASQVMKVTLKDVEDRALWSIELMPQIAPEPHPEGAPA
jgi:hypothetical protein